MLRSVFEILFAFFGFTSSVAPDCAKDRCSFFDRPPLFCPDIYDGTHFTRNPLCDNVTGLFIESDGTVDLGL